MALFQADQPTRAFMATILTSIAWQVGLGAVLYGTLLVLNGMILYALDLLIGG
ncbi:MAG: hypothetical protein GYB68_13635 [Chloroflexi bacterium]|nr:hypothetical protein [Chloroflexota bacterium]